MAGTPPKRNVAIFIDMENLFGGYKNDVTSVPIGSIVREIEKVIQERGLGSLTATARAYANWGRSDMAGYRSEMLENGVEPVQIFSFDQNTKNAADIELVVDALEVATESPWVDVFVIVSGDGGFVPLIRRLHVLGKHAVVVTTSHPNAGGVNKILKSVADHFHVIDVPDAKPASTSPSPGALATQKKSAQKQPGAGAVPTLKQFAASVHALIKDEPELMVEGLVNGARLGNLLRTRWPGITYQSFGFGSLARFVEDGCGLKILRPSTSKPGAVDPLAAKSVADIKAVRS